MPKREWVLVAEASESHLDYLEAELIKSMAGQPLVITRFNDWLRDTIGLNFDLSKFQLPPLNAAINLPKQDVSEVVQKVFEQLPAEAPPVDMSKVTLTDGSPVPKDRSHTQLCFDGQQKAYVVLAAEERAKGYVRPVRSSYRHLKCGSVTTMGPALAETYAREPHFYSGTYCSTCGAHFPVGEDGEFEWLDGTKVGT